MRQSFLRAVLTALTPPDAPARTVWVVAAFLVVARSAVFAFSSRAFFDSDQAVFGLMAKHLSEGRAFPLFMYGQNYILAVEAWMAAPLFLVGGASVALLKLPLVLISVVSTLLLVGLLVREARLPAWGAFVACLFFILPPPGTAAQLMEASGGNLEPFLYVLLLWIARRHGVWFGVILAVGFLHREFTVYGLMAVLAVDACDGTLVTRASLREKTRAALAFGAVWALVWMAKSRASAAGPGTSLADISAPASNVSELLARFCGDLGAVVRGASAIYTEYLAYLLGLRVQPVTEFAVNSTVTQGMPGLGILMATFVVVCVVAAIARAVAPGSPTPAAQGFSPAPVRVGFTFYLGLIGSFAIVFYAWGRCGELSIFTLRYGLLGLFAMIALTAGALQSTPLVRRIAIALVLVWTLASAAAHVRIVAEYARQPPPNWRGIIADYLVERGVKYAKADYWTAYHVTFLSGERVIVGADDPTRIATYQRLLEAHRDEVWSITKERCAAGLQVIPEWYVCPP